MADEIIVDMGKYEVATNPTVLVCMSLGSCVGVALYDSEKKIGGFAHVMLPKSDQYSVSGRSLNLNKFANIALPGMIDKMKQEGSKLENITAKIAGGAHMFPGVECDMMDIGKKNLDAVREELRKQGIRIIASDVGGNVGRTVRFDISEWKLTIKTKNEVKEI
ncbi:chemotaxis protein CheD [Candidatus Woesearchaeota archaeon]|nr:chemotaxis protein CheD [Candidatus Woesearchaeota archaeon]